MALKLFGVTVSDARAATASTLGTELVVLRELGAICRHAETSARDPSDDDAKGHAEIISAFLAGGPVLPAPVGVAFRGRESVTRWLELHYGALTDALAFVDNRVAARVHVWGAGGGDTRDISADLAAIAAESLRMLRKSAVSTVPVRFDKLTGIVLSAAFLIEAQNWSDFAAQVDAQSKATSSVRLELTGPWPPYDFVQMQLEA